MRLTNRIAIAFVLLISGPSSAIATLITFDDLPAQLGQPSWDGIRTPMPLTTQYEHLGVSFGDGIPELIAQGKDGNDGAAISRYETAAISAPNAISDVYGPGMSFTFIGDELPDYVSFEVTGYGGVGVLGTAHDAQGNQVASFMSDGFWGTPEMSTPAIPGQLIELEAENIQRVSLSNLYNRRGYTHLDNLIFKSSRPVPEPGAWTLLLGALLALALRRSGGVVSVPHRN